MTKWNKIIYWTSTILFLLGMVGGGTAQLLRLKQNVEGIVHLGYPLYILTLLPIWKFLGSIALLLPKYLLVKEWAYAGFFFLMTGAVFSHLASGDGVKIVSGPAILLALVIVSWFFRPADRKIMFTNK